ncbi:hypothetical protein [Truepera radiovictrix]|uniref:ABC-type amino acid transport system permease component n=1 Tax=Truepera radiovictrix (strain DSM 17093 / CIP 108686 / LMG 22925 / RQ-24) TaxID=649638 RepID=D7CTQ6_TRURR|nr:hypothetical protein [Truepera radiovictrix]ADI15603.1 ABC-type amino acid transport system permease component [Truepera radiovictrix DSM 17093]WMT58768.1 hypothetical protein RCV51_07425 [Truepera radiovictrix]
MTLFLPRALRRLVVLAQWLVSLPLVLWALLFGLPTWLWMGGLALSLLLSVWLDRATGRVVHLGHARLDERQRAFKAHVYFRAYRALCLVIAALVAICLLFEPATPPTSTEVYRAAFVFLLFAAGWLPLSLTAWLEPDPPTEELSRPSKA